MYIDRPRTYCRGCNSSVDLRRLPLQQRQRLQQTTLQQRQRLQQPLLFRVAEANDPEHQDEDAATAAAAAATADASSETHTSSCKSSFNERFG